MSSPLVVLTESDTIAQMLKCGSYSVLRVRSVKELTVLCKHGLSTPSLVVDLDMPGAFGGEGTWDVIRTIRAILPMTVIIGTAQHLETRRVVEVIRAGASQFIKKDRLATDLGSTVDSESAPIGEARKRSGEQDLFTDSPDIDALAANGQPILIVGEPHSGKALLARFIHSQSMQRDLPFVRIGCGSLKSDLGLRELMGYERGSFVGAFRSCKGLLAEAGGGTILFEDLHLLNVGLQKVLEGVIGSGTVRPCGGSPVAFEARVIATSHLSLEVMRAEGISSTLLSLFTEIAAQVRPLRVGRGEILSAARELLEEAAGTHDLSLMDSALWDAFHGYSQSGT